MNILITIIVLLVMLGILISAHEAGHLFVAKCFGVYCDEYSIGFGPKLFSFKRKGAETTFSLRAIPLGGYVSMYGEEAKDENDENEDDRFKNIPVERSLEGVAAWKKALILVAGITVNLFISFLFCLIYAISFPSFQTYRSFLAPNIAISETSSSHINTKMGRYENTFGGEAGTVYIGIHENQPWVYGFYVSGDADVIGENSTNKEENPYRLIGPALTISKDQKNYGFILDSDALFNNKDHVVVLYYPTSEQGDKNLYSCITLYSPLQDASNKYVESPADSLERELGIQYYPDFSSKIQLKEGDSLNFSFSIASEKNVGEIVAKKETKNVTIKRTASGFEGPSISTYSNEYWAPFGDRLLAGCQDWVNFFPAIGEGIKSLFLGNFNSVGGVVAMGSGLSQLSSYMGWGKTFFYYGGLISLNLAIFNLFPFPGLDGWGLLVTAVEKIFKKKIPQKAKAIVSLIGFGILILLAGFITVKDIIALF